MADFKKYFVVDDLVKLCEKLNLESDGTKSELIERLQAYEPGTSRVSFCSTRVTLPPSISQSTQTLDESLDLKVTRSSKAKKYFQWFTTFAIWIGFCGAIFSFSQNFFGFESISVKRPWF